MSFRSFSWNSPCFGKDLFFLPLYWLTPRIRHFPLQDEVSVDLLQHFCNKFDDYS